jgi:pimeloyl-ACP methyl ester carboxylesterase
MKNVNYKGLSLRIHGTNHKTHIWFIHGFGETADSFSAVENNSDILANYPIRIPDLPGCGKSNTMSFDSIEDTAQILVESINEFSLNKDIIIVAHSMGTLIGEKIAEKLNHRIKLFISIEGFLIQYKERFSSTILQYDDPLQFYNAFVKKISGANADLVSETYLDHILSCTPQALYAWAKSCYAMTSNYINLKCKLVYMCGTKSAYKPELELLQSASIDIIQFDNCGHWVMHDASNFYEEVFRLCFINVK